MRATRDKISQNFSAINSQADGVLFETGRSRPESLRVRNLLLGWQPRLRSIFLLQIALLQYRSPVSPAELPGDILKAEAALDFQVKAVLEDMAKAFQSGCGGREQTASLAGAFAGFKAAINQTYGDRPTPRAAAVVSLSSHLVESTIALHKELRQSKGRLF